jgi:hypothetical protein
MPVQTCENPTYSLEDFSMPLANQPISGNEQREPASHHSTHAGHEPHTSPEIKIETLSLRDIMSVIPRTELQSIKNILALDNRLENCRAAILAENPGLKALSPELATPMVATLGKGLSEDTQKALTSLVNFYLGYLRAFPLKSETEPLANLVNYMTDPEKNWTAIMAISEDGKILGACSGEIIDVTISTGSVKIAMNEHAWVDASFRRQGIGQFISRKFDEHAKSFDAIGVFAEVENPYCLTTDEQGLSQENERERRKYWTDPPPEGRGWPIDPFRRLAFWGHDGYRLVCSGEPPVPIPYVQVSMELGEVGCCDVVIPVFKAFKTEYQMGFSKELYRALVLAFQKTIDPEAPFYPELVRTLREIDETPGETLHMIGLEGATLNEALKTSAQYKLNCAQTDLAYCHTRLSDSTMSTSERRVIEKAKAFLESQASIAA